jgi:hypothetical protein
VNLGAESDLRGSTARRGDQPADARFTGPIRS